MTMLTKNLAYTVRTLSIFLVTIIISNFTIAESSLAEDSLYKKTYQNIAIIDTGFCPHLLPQHPLIKIHSVHFAMESFVISCNEADLNSPRLHGQKVLKTFIENYRGTKELQLFPIIVFDKAGIQTVDYWKMSMPHILKNQIRYVLSATGVPLRNKISALLPKKTHFILASGRVEPNLKEMAYLFPHDFLLEKQKTIVGSQVRLSESIIKDPKTFQADKVNVWIDEDPSIDFKGSSYAVAKYFADYLSLTFKK